MNRQRARGDLSPLQPYADLSTPAPVRETVRHTVPVPVDHDTTVRAIANLLVQSQGFRRLSADFDAEVVGLSHLLEPYGIEEPSIRAALGLTSHESGPARGTIHAPNARLAEHRATLTGGVKDARNFEVYFRAAYIANAAQRMQREIDAGASPDEALRRERAHYVSHEHARKGRLNAAAQVQRAARMFGAGEQGGTLVGWYLNPLLRNDVECITANGRNFYAERGTVIGLPGAVHNRCGCYAGAPHEGADMVDDVLGNVVKFQRSAKPKFKLKESRSA